MQKKIRIVSLFLALLLIVPALFACREIEETTTNTTKSQSNVSTDDDYDIDEYGNKYLKDKIPSDTDYGRKEVNILGWEESKEVDFYVEDTVNASIVESTLHARNEVVEARIGIDLKFYFQPGNNPNRAEFTKHIEMLSDTGAYDIIGAYSMVGAALAMNGSIVNMLQFENLDFEGPWWNKTLLENCMFGGKLYFASGDIATSTLLQAFCIQMNLDMLDANGCGDPRQDIIDGNWTLEKMFGMGLGINPVAGDTSESVYGFTYSHSVFFDGFFTGAGLRYMDTNIDKFIIASTFQSTITDNLLKYLGTQLYVSNDNYAKADATIFENNRALFRTAAITDIITTKDQVSCTYSFAPFPKYDEDQDDYYTTVGFPFSLFMIPVDAPDKDMSAIVLECLASQSYRQMRPVIYNTLKYQQANDSLDAKLFDIIATSVTFDIGRLYTNYFDVWSTTPVALFRDCAASSVMYTMFTSRTAEASGIIDGVLGKMNKSLFG